VFMYRQSDSTVSTLSRARPGSWIRTPSETSAGSSSVPLSTTECTASVIASMNVVAPGLARKRTVVVERKRRSPRVRSRTTS
jgi:hypothetical protein